jgi:glutaredoxin
VGADVTLYSRPGCGLCDEAREVLQAVRERIGFDLREVDISGDDALERAYGVRIPVVVVNGEELFEISVDEGELEAVLGPD